MSQTDLMKLTRMAEQVEEHMKNPQSNSLSLVGVMAVKACALGMQIAAVKIGYETIFQQKNSEIDTLLKKQKKDVFIYEPREDLAQFLEGVVGVCEATRCEYNYL